MARGRAPLKKKSAYGTSIVLLTRATRSVVQRFSIIMYYYLAQGEITLDRQGSSQTAKIHELIRF